MTTNVNNALELAAQGLPVFPVWWMAAPGVCGCPAGADCDAKQRGKHPITPRGHNDATVDADKIVQLWGIAPAANIGVAVPDGLVVVDVDPRNDGVATFDALEAEHGFPETRWAKTGGGGAHFWFRVPAGWALPGRLGEGVDVKQLGGYVLAPGSNHASGGVYAWASSPLAPVALAPDWLLRMGRPRGERATVVVDEDERVADDATLDAIVAAVEPHYTEGRKHHIAKNLAGWMKQRGFGVSDAVYVVERLPAKNPQARAKAAVAAFGIERSFGWNELRGLVGEEHAAALDAAVPNPRQERELEETAAASGLVAAMAASAVEVQPLGAALNAPANDPGADPWSAWAQEIDLTQDPPPMPWVVKDLEIGPGRPTAILGYANSAKTPFALALAIGVASGRPVLDMPVTRGRVAWLGYEATRVTHGKARRIARGLAVDDLSGLSMHRMKRLLTEPGAVEAIRDVVFRKQFLLCVIDTYSSAIAGVDHNSQDFAVPLRALERVSDETGVTFLVLVHSKKDTTGDLTDFAGHNSAAGAVQAMIGLNRPEPEDKFLIQVACVRELDRPFQTFRLRFVDEGSVGELVTGGALRLIRVAETVTAAADPILVGCEKILGFLRHRAPDGSQVRWTTLLEEVKHRHASLNAARDRLVRDRQLHISNGTPMMVGLVAGAQPFEPRSFAPPSARENTEAMHAALLASKGVAAE